MFEIHMLFKFSPAIQILLLFVFLALVLLIFNLYKKSLKSEIIETRDFSCPGIGGFTFKYPVSSGWGIQSTVKKHSDDQFCFVVFNKNSTAGNKTAQFTVQKINRPGYPAPGSPILEYPPKLSLKNPQDIPYQGDRINSSSNLPVTSAVNSVKFYTDDFVVEVMLDGMDTAGEDFSSDVFFKTIIESFRITKEHTLQVGQTVSLSDPNGRVLKITLDSIDLPKTQTPGNRPFYNLTLTNGSSSKQLVFDPFNSGRTTVELEFSFQIINNPKDTKELEVIF